MPQIIFILADGERRAVDTTAGRSLMDVAVRSNLPGILAECGGACACATCHVHVDPEWSARLTPPSALELSMLEFVEGLGETSRLSCQIKATDDLDGLVLRVPASQGF